MLKQNATNPFFRMRRHSAAVDEALIEGRTSVPNSEVLNPQPRHSPFVPRA
jgi:hypothetical protein